MPVKFGQMSLRFWFFLSYLITTLPTHLIHKINNNKNNDKKGGKNCRFRRNKKEFAEKG